MWLGYFVCLPENIWFAGVVLAIYATNDEVSFREMHIPLKGTNEIFILFLVILQLTSVPVAEKVLYGHDVIFPLVLYRFYLYW